jgi:hypothetical protein
MAKQMKQEETEVKGLPAIREQMAVGEVAYGEDAFGGFEGLGSEFYSVPLMGILQKMSPQVDADHAKFIDGAKPGMVINNVTGELIDAKGTGFPFIACHVTHAYVEWIPRDEGGGYVGTHEPGTPTVLKALADAGRGNKPKTTDGNELVETFYLYGLLVKADGGFEQVIIPFTSTNIKVLKKWLTTARGIAVVENGRRVTPPLFAHVYRIGTVLNTKDENTWYGYTVTFDGEDAAGARLDTKSELYQAAKLFRQMAASGNTKIEGLESQEGGTGGNGELDAEVM